MCLKNALTAVSFVVHHIIKLIFLINQRQAEYPEYEYTDNHVLLFLFQEIWKHPGRFNWTNEIQAKTESHPDPGGHHKAQCGQYWNNALLL